MNVNKIKAYIEENRERTLSFKINGSRNQVEEFKGKIISTYRAIFLIRLEESDMVKSFAYTDVLIGNLEIKV